MLDGMAPGFREGLGCCVGSGRKAWTAPPDRRGVGGMSRVI